MTSRLTVKEPEIELYVDGFEAKEGGVSDLGRKKDGKKLSDLVEKIEEPMVIAVDAPWGAGKSVFLRCWVGEHIKDEHGNQATTVYFDAFQHDFLDDPLIALTGVISDRFTKDEKHSKVWGKLKNAAYKLRKPAVRLSAFAASSGISEIAVPVVDAIADAAAKELAKASEEFWKKEDGKRAAMQSFHDALKELAAEQKLVIVVDELDRCRPDYALNLLEVIKHFFNVPNVHFVLGVNLTELENSVRARYGAGVNASKYLQKFYNVRMPLSLEVPTHGEAGSLYSYFKERSERLALDKKSYLPEFEVYFQAFSNIPNFSLRDANAILTAAMFAPSPTHRDGDIAKYLTAGLIALKILDPALYGTLRDRLFNGTNALEQILVKLGLLDMPPDLVTSDIQKVTLVWNWALSGADKVGPSDSSLRAKGISGSIPGHGRTHLRKLMRERVDTFEYAGID
ncbi:KAP family P-loop NTPase fold protein [Celeribacter litoreus]|uniref:KAP family P-loop NTPase fold protein n=1 Tax=Celeribacter litoreus TaxID=2876714 RepID=UPI001CCC873E|nr:P-loop NTPase fold protein [Celeribacter litoreus]MCA0042618.1 KAP family NTPase [Celeribacter litoreus]